MLNVLLVSRGGFVLFLLLLIFHVSRSSCNTTFFFFNPFTFNLLYIVYTHILVSYLFFLLIVDDLVGMTIKLVRGVNWHLHNRRPETT